MTVDMKAFEYDPTKDMEFYDVFFGVMQRLEQAGILQHEINSPDAFRPLREDIDDATNTRTATIALAEDYNRLIQKRQGEVLEITVPLAETPTTFPELLSMEDPYFDLRHITETSDVRYRVDPETYVRLFQGENPVIADLKEKIEKGFQLIPSHIPEQRDVDTEN